MTRGTEVRHSGEWPGAVVLRHGLSKAVARPWNQDVPDAHLALIRGSSAFLEMCADHLHSIGVSSVLSPPLPQTSAGLWMDAGYKSFEQLDVFGRALADGLREPERTVTTERHVDWDEIQGVDRRAFEPFWRLDTAGLDEASTATPSAAVLTVRDPDLLGFAIVGAGATAGYLQRIAVSPSAQRHGVGRDLVRASLRWARRHGARQMLLNTLGDNAAAAKLYETEGFSHLDDHLVILRRVAE